MEVDIVASQVKESVFSQRLQEHGVCFRELSGSQKNVLENYRLFRELLRERRYDVVHLNIFQGMSLYYAHLAKQAGVPVRIAHSHNTDLRKSRTRQVKLWLHRLYSRRYSADATAFWACSKKAAKFLFPTQMLGQRDFIFIPNGIDTEKFRFDPVVREDVRRELGITDQFVIGNVGRLCYQKNQSFLLDVFAEVVRLQPKSRLLLVGEGEDLDMLREKARSQGFEDRVIFYGASDQVERLLWATDVFVMPSRFEGLPVTAIEAQAAGLPCLLSDAITKECCVGKYTRFLPLTNNAATWAETLMMVDQSKNRSIGADSIRQAKFDVADSAAFIESAYKEKA